MTRARAMPQVEWARIALDCGYSDQARLCRDFKSITGVTRTMWLDLGRPGDRHLPVFGSPRQAKAIEGVAAPWEVKFLQDPRRVADYVRTRQ